MTGELTEARRREATRAFIRYFSLVFLVVLGLSSLGAWAIIDARRQRADSRALRIEYCRELEKLKAQNREDVRDDIKHFHRTLRLLHLKDTPEIRRVARQGWEKKLARNAPKRCPYKG